MFTNFIRYSLCIAFSLLVCNNIHAQIACTTINLADTVYACPNSSVQLIASLTIPTGDVALDTIWSPSIGLSDTDSITTVATIGTTPTKYFLNIRTLTLSNLVNNGDFSAGNTGFSSSYRDTSGPSSLYPEGFYTVVNNPNSVHPGFVSMGDHTTGTGNMMVVNGASSPVSVWCQVIAVTPNTYYDFSAWGATISPAGNPAVLQFSINGSLVGTSLSLSNSTGIWQQFHTVWYSGSNTSIDICITDQQTALGGNDFAIDDISFRQICFSSDSVYIAIAHLKDSIIVNQLPCMNGQVSLSAVMIPGYKATTSFNWSFGDGATNSGASVSHTYPHGGNFNTTLIMKNDSGCVDTMTGSVFVNNFVAPVPISHDTTVCPGGTAQLWVGDALSYKWSPANGLNSSTIQSPTARPRKTTTYYALIKVDSNCFYTDSVMVTVYNLPAVTATYTGEPLSCRNAIASVHATGANTYLWYPTKYCDDSTSANPNVSPIITTKFVVKGTDANGCIAFDSVIVPVSDIADVYVPSAFTPNGDGRNDHMRAIPYCGFTLEYFEIFNRWGQRLFYAIRDQREGWDGTQYGSRCEIGTYYYLVKGMSLEGREIMKKGEFELIR